MRLDRQENIEIARPSAAHPRLALARQPDARAVLNAGRHIDREAALAGDAAGAGAAVARIFDDLTAALAGRASGLDGEETLLPAHPALAGAGAAGGRLGAGFGAGAQAGLAGQAGRQLDGGVLALVGVFEGDFEIVAQVRAALLAGGVAGAAA